MKRMLCVFFLGTLLTGVWPGDARAQQKPIYFISAGVAAPASSSLTDFWYPGIGVGGGIEYFIRPSLAVQGQLSFTRFGFDAGKFKAENDALGVLSQTSGGDKNLFGGFVSLKYTKTIDSDDLDVRAVPFAVAGLGFLSYSEADIQGIEIGGREIRVSGESGAGFAVNAGAGIDIRLTDRVHLVVEGRLEVGFTSGERENTQLFPVRVGISFE